MQKTNLITFRRRKSSRRAWRVTGALVLVAVISWCVFRPTPQSQRQAGDHKHDRFYGRQTWIYGRRDVRFTIVEYADLECPYCRDYFPTLRQWVDEHPSSANWQWHHMPLSIHEPAATHEARLAQCMGEVSGNDAFWLTVGWIYQHTQSNGIGLPANVEPPGINPEIRACITSTRADGEIQSQAAEAAQKKILGTPTLEVLDHHTGRSLVLSGPVERDALLSAMDLLATQAADSAR